jgi:ketosteroid isomerase-like protein
MVTLPESRSSETLIRAFYDARARNGLATVRGMLDEDVIWREPDVGNEHTGDLHGADTVLGMIQEALRLTNGTFTLRVTKLGQKLRYTDVL